MIEHRLSQGLRLGLLGAAAALLSGCAGLGSTAPAPSPAPVADAPVSAPAPAAASDPNPALERRISSLELELLEKEQQVHDLQAHLNDARREVVRAMAKLQSLATRAEAASGIAEAEIALETLPSDTAAQAVAEARGLMELSTAEFDKQNYGGALYLANQAKSAAAMARQRLEVAELGELRAEEQPFALPLALQTTAVSNVRGGPGLGFKVLFTLPANAQLTGYSSAEQWLRVADDSGRRGWISQSLIRSRP